MRVLNITYSPTGGTKKVSDLVATQFMNELAVSKEDISLIPFHINYNEITMTKKDICIISVPSFGGRVPADAVSKLSKIKGNGAYCVLVCVYGNRAYEDTLKELSDTVKNIGFKPVAAIAAVAEHSIMRQFASGRPDAMDQKEIKSFAKKIFKKISTYNVISEVVVPGNDIYKNYNGVPFKPETEENCIKCGKCVKECPVNAIDINVPDKVDKEKCISCMRCISVCPENARKLNQNMLDAASEKMRELFVDKKENELFL